MKNRVTAIAVTALLVACTQFACDLALQPAGTGLKETVGCDELWMPPDGVLGIVDPESIRLTSLIQNSLCHAGFSKQAAMEQVEEFSVTVVTTEDEMRGAVILTDGTRSAVFGLDANDPDLEFQLLNPNGEVVVSVYDDRALWADGTDVHLSGPDNQVGRAANGIGGSALILLKGCLSPFSVPAAACTVGLLAPEPLLTKLGYTACLALVNTVGCLEAYEAAISQFVDCHCAPSLTVDPSSAGVEIRGSPPSIDFKATLDLEGGSICPSLVFGEGGIGAGRWSSWVVPSQLDSESQLLPVQGTGVASLPDYISSRIEFSQTFVPTGPGQWTVAFEYTPGYGDGELGSGRSFKETATVSAEQLIELRVTGGTGEELTSYSSAAGHYSVGYFRNNRTVTITAEESECYEFCRWTSDHTDPTGGGRRCLYHLGSYSNVDSRTTTFRINPDVLRGPIRLRAYYTWKSVACLDDSACSVPVVDEPDGPVQRYCPSCGDVMCAGLNSGPVPMTPSGGSPSGRLTCQPHLTGEALLGSCETSFSCACEEAGLGM